MTREDAIIEASHFLHTRSSYLFKNGHPHRDTLLAKAFWEGYEAEQFSGLHGAWYESFYHAGQELRIES